MHGGSGRNDVGLVSPVGEDAVDALFRANVLTESSNIHVAEDRCIKRVSAFPRVRSSMSRLTIPSHAELLHSNCGHPSEIDISGVNHHCRVDAGESAPIDHEYLSAATFLGGRSENDKPAI
jgi:hypothetical protein